MGKISITFSEHSLYKKIAFYKNKLNETLQKRIIAFLKRLFSKFPELTIEYGQDEDRNDHLIKIFGYEKITEKIETAIKTFKLKTIPIYPDKWIVFVLDEHETIEISQIIYQSNV